MRVVDSGQDDVRWRAVVDRLPMPDQVFVYAVTTTRVYCRPGCPSRRPNRANVVYFDRPEEARAAGFRACLRCRPDEPADTGVARCVERARRRLDTDEAEPTLSELAAEAGLSPGHFQRLFKAWVGVSPKGYARAVRATRLRTALEEGATVTEAIYGAGYGGPARAHGEAGAALGMSPSAYRKGGAGEVIDYTMGDCVLGRVLVAATPRGLCAVFLGDDDAALYDSLRARFPRADVRPDGDSARAVLPTVQTLAAEPGRPFDGPLDVRGTAFQLKVWDALRRIPPGETRTYGTIAGDIGQPTAARAVARACADNPVAMVVPCHRVLRGDGCPGGYRWGTARKLALLEAEQDSQDQG